MKPQPPVAKRQSIPKSRLATIAVCLLFVFWCFVFSVRGQTVPHIGYVYPAGGQPGSTFEITIGGQNLDGAEKVVFSAAGIEATLLNFTKPMAQGQFNMLRDQLTELREKKHAASLRNGSGSSTNTWTAADELKMEEIRQKILKNPPNRNAAPAIAEIATFKVIIATNAVSETGELRIETPNGISNPLRFYIGRTREFSKPAARTPNPDLDRFLEKLGRAPQKTSTKSESRVFLPATINGQIMPGSVDRFRFTGRQGQKLVVRVSARELIPYLPDAVPGWFQATLAVYDARGSELQFADDYRFNPDPVVFFQLPADGDYVIEIRDAIYRGREDFVYRIEIGELPFITGLFPLGGRVGRETAVEFDGRNLPASGSKLFFESTGVQLLTAPQSGGTINSALFVVDDLPEYNEVEHESATSQKITLPIVVNGRIQRPGDADIYCFEAGVGSEVVAEVFARRLNSPLDSLLRLTDSTGKQIALNDDHEDKGAGLATHHADSYLRAKLPSAGTYYVHITDAQRQGGKDFGYRLRISAPQPDFDLRVVPSSINVRVGMSAPVTVYALRKDGFTNEVQLALKDAPPGFSLAGGRIPGNQESVRVTLLASSVPKGGPVSLKLEGRALAGNRPIEHMAVPAEDMMQAFAYRHLVPAKELMAFVSPRGIERRTLEIAGKMPIEIPVGGTTRVHLHSSARFPVEKVRLELGDPPEGITLQNVSATNGGVDLEFRGDAKTAPGAQGNLIIGIFLNGKQKGTQGAAPLAVLPAIPFEVTAK